MNIRSVTFDQLTSDEIAAWSAIQRAEPLLGSPYFRPEFTQCTAEVRKDVEIAVIEENQRPIGFLPFQRTRRNTGHPVAGIVSDFQGLIAPENVRCDPLAILRGCGLTAWHFDHLYSHQSTFAPFVWRYADSPVIDLSRGLEAFVARRANGHLLSEYGQKKRKLIRNVGPVRYEHHCPDQQIVATLFAWKSEQYERTGVPDIFQCRWIRNLLDNILSHNSEEFGAIVSVLYAGDTLAAIHLGMRSGGVLHTWFPAYNIELSRYSPGTLQWIETIKSAASWGIQHIDLGKGEEPYKRRLMTGATRVAEGTVDVRSSTALVRRAWWNTRDRLRASPLATPARVPLRIALRFRNWLATD